MILFVDCWIKPPQYYYLEVVIFTHIIMQFSGIARIYFVKFKIFTKDYNKCETIK
jgi:hypothetical protein